MDWCRATRTNPLQLERLREQFLPESSFRGRQHKKLQYAILAAALHGGTEPDLLEVAWWQTDDFGSTPSTPRSPTSAPPPARQGSPYARHARTWPSA